MATVTRYSLGAVDKYRKEAHERYHGRYSKYASWRDAILESIFRPRIEVPGKHPMSHLHPNIKNLHMPHGVYIADWRKYRVEDHPALMNFQKRCHAAGLHDPWLRNYCHQWYPNTTLYRSRLAFITVGCFFGFCGGAALNIAEKVYDHYFPPQYLHSKEYIEKYGNREIHRHN